MHWNTWVRQLHCWVSFAFTVAVVANIIAMAQAAYANWLGLLALLPLALLLLTGLYLFVLPYAVRWRSARGVRMGVNTVAGGRAIGE